MSVLSKRSSSHRYTRRCTATKQTELCPTCPSPQVLSARPALLQHRFQFHHSLLRFLPLLPLLQGHLAHHRLSLELKHRFEHATEIHGMISTLLMDMWYDCAQCLSRVMVKNTHVQQRASHLPTHGHQCHYLKIFETCLSGCLSHFKSFQGRTVSRSLPPTWQELKPWRSSWVKTNNPYHNNHPFWNATRILEDQNGSNMKETYTD